MSVLKDAPIGKAAKAMIVFYNLSDKPAALKTANGKVGIIANIEPGQNGSREINALPVSLAVFEDGTNVAAIDSVDLKRNESTAIILDKTPDGKFTATKTQATTDTKQ
jgi:alginate O-acetyltransferase complex protein AlgF